MSSARIGSFIQECRKEKKLTQEELGEKIGVSSKSISRWENNITMPDLSLITIVAKELNVEVSELLNGKRMNRKELLELRTTVDKMIKYFDYEEKTKKEKINFLLLAQLIILSLTLINIIFVFNSSIQYIINIIFIILSIIINLFRLYESKNDCEFKARDMKLSKDTNGT